MREYGYIIFNHEEFFKPIAEKLSLSPLPFQLIPHRDGEFSIFLKESLPQKVIIFACPRHHKEWFELLLLTDAFLQKKASLTIVFSYLGYDRTHRTDPWTLMEDLLYSRGVQKIILLDRHQQGHERSHNILATSFWSSLIIQKKVPLQGPLVVISPDLGGEKRARGLAQHLKCSYIVGEKIRYEDSMRFDLPKADLTGKQVIIIDDMIDSGKTLFSLVEALKGKTSPSIVACATHSLMKGDGAIHENLDVFTTNTVPFDASQPFLNIKRLSINDYLAEELIKIL